MEEAHDAELNDVLQKAIDSSISSNDSSGKEIEQQKRRNIVNLSDDERANLLEEQIRTNKYHKFVQGNMIIKQGEPNIHINRSND